MYNFLNKNGQSLAFVIGGILALIAAIKGANSDVGLPITIAMTMLIGALGIWVLLELFSLAGHPKKAIKGLIGIGALVIIFFIAKSIGSAETDAALAEVKSNVKVTYTEGDVNWIGGGLVTTFVLIGIAILSFVWGELKGLFS